MGHVLILRCYYLFQQNCADDWIRKLVEARSGSRISHWGRRPRWGTLTPLGTSTSDACIFIKNVCENEIIGSPWGGGDPGNQWKQCIILWAFRNMMVLITITEFTYQNYSHKPVIVYRMGRLCGGAHQISGIKAPLFLRGWVGGWVSGGGVGWWWVVVLGWVMGWEWWGGGGGGVGDGVFGGW